MSCTAGLLVLLLFECIWIFINAAVQRRLFSITHNPVFTFHGTGVFMYFAILLYVLIYYCFADIYITEVVTDTLPDD